MMGEQGTMAFYYSLMVIITIIYFDGVLSEDNFQGLGWQSW